MKRAISAALAAASIAACGSGDDSREEPPRPALETALLKAKRLAFTFEYPKRYYVRKRRRGQPLVTISLARRGTLNAINVRKTADREMPPERYLSEFRRDFARAGRDVRTRLARVGGVTAGVLEVAGTRGSGDDSVPFTSSSYFFAGAGTTWQLECVAGDDNREELEAACRLAVRSIEFQPRHRRR